MPGVNCDLYCINQSIFSVSLIHQCFLTITLIITRISYLPSSHKRCYIPGFFFIDPYDSIKKEYTVYVVRDST